MSTKRWEQWEIESLISDFRKNFSMKIVDWNNTTLFEWEYELLKHIQAIDDNAILNNYPLIQIGDNEWKDLDGDVQAVGEEVERINKDSKGKKAKISWCPRGYSLWVDIKRARDAKEIEANDLKRQALS